MYTKSFAQIDPMLNRVKTFIQIDEIEKKVKKEKLKNFIFRACHELQTFNPI